MDARDPSSEENAQTLLEQAAWVGALARSLVRDEATAQDVVQETWLAALKSAPRESGRLKPWLAHVLANAAKKRGRTEQRREKRERAVARPDRSPSPDEIAERFETQRLLLAELEALEEPFKRTLVLRYLDGLEPAEIARRESVPGGTVRWRLSEGLERLRQRLDRRFGGDRGTWALACLPFTSPPALTKLAASALVASSGVLVMNAALRAALIVVVLLGGSVAALRAAKSKSNSPHIAGVDEAALQAAAPQAGDGRSALQAAAEADSRASASAAANAVASTAPERVPATEPDAATTRVSGRCVDTEHHAVPQAILLLPQTASLLLTVTCDADGRFAVDVQARANAWTQSVRVRKHGYATSMLELQLESGRPHELGEVVLERAGLVSGRVEDATGRGVPKLAVIAAPAQDVTDLEYVRANGPPRAGAFATCTTDADGGFRIVDARPGVVRLIAGDGGRGWAVSEVVELEADEESGPVVLRFEAKAGALSIRGWVRDPDGRPVARADVAFRGERAGALVTQGGARCDSEGRFEIDGRDGDVYTLVATDAQSRWSPSAAVRAEPGTQGVEVALAVPLWCRLDIRDRDGVPVHTVRIRPSSSFGGPGRLTLKDNHPDGLRLLLPSAAFELEIEADGFDLGHLGPIDPAQLMATRAPDGVAQLTCVLERLDGVRGRVTFDGAPVAGAKLTLHALLGRERSIRVNGRPTRFDAQPRDTTTSAADGSFQLDARTPDDYVVLCDKESFALAELELPGFDAHVAHAAVELALVRGGSIEGRVRTAPGTDPAGAIVLFDRYDGRARTLRADRDGHFRLDGLTPGGWWVSTASREIFREGSITSLYPPSDTSPFVIACEVANGQVTHFDLDAPARAGTDLEVEVTLDGAPVLGWNVWARRADDPLPSGAGARVTDARGRARIESLGAGHVKISVAPPPEARAGFEIGCERSLGTGANTWTLALESGSLRGRVPVEAGASSFVTWTPALGDAHASARTAPDGDGRFEFPLALAGTGDLRWSTQRADERSSSLRAERVITVRRGETTTVELP